MGRQEQQIIELVLRRVANCGQCGGDYGRSDVNVLGHKEDLWFLLLTCGSCRQAVGVAAVVKEQSRPAAGRDAAEPESSPAFALPPAWTDEAGKEPGSAPVSSDDVVAIRQFLEHFDGDFRRLFR